MLLLAACNSPVPEPYGPVPTDAQLAWQRMEINMFCHFGPNTFTGAEWGSGDEAESLFNPTALDCRQWVDVAEQAGMKGIILTAKHHDGFCLWPSAYSSHTVTQSPWNEGHGDVLREFTDACRGRVKAGFYLSPWDRHDSTYGTPQYNDRFEATLKEVLSSYHDIYEQWFDGANGEGPNGKRQKYDWERFNATVARLQPNALVFSDVGPGCRWVGNEEGKAGETCWSTIDVDGCEPGTGNPSSNLLMHGRQDGKNWIPAEADISIRPGWFWHADEHPKTVDELMEIYYNSIRRNALLLLNVPPDSRGLIPAEDSAVLVAFRAERDRIFAHDIAQGGVAHGEHLRGRRYRADNVLDTAYHTYWAAASNDATLTIDLDSVTEFDIIVIQEYIPLGQRVTMVNLAIDEGDGISLQTSPEHPLCTTVGYKRILRCDNDKRWRTDHLELRFNALAPPIINRIALYNSKAQ